MCLLDFLETVDVCGEFWVRISHISLNCVHVMFLLADGFKLVYSAWTYFFLLSTPFFFLLLSLWQNPTESIQYWYDYVSWQESADTSLCLLAHVHACITVCPTWRSDSWNIWQKMCLFPEKEKQRRPQNDTRLLFEARKSTFFSWWIHQFR